MPSAIATAATLCIMYYIYNIQNGSAQFWRLPKIYNTACIPLPIPTYLVPSMRYYNIEETAHYKTTAESHHRHQPVVVVAAVTLL